MSEHDVLTEFDTDPRHWPARSLVECLGSLRRLARRRGVGLVGGLDLDEAVREIQRRLQQHQALVANRLVRLRGRPAPPVASGEGTDPEGPRELSA